MTAPSSRQAPAPSSSQQPHRPPPAAAAWLLALGCLTLSYFAAEILIPILFSVFVFFLFDPIVVRLERKKIPRGLSSPMLVVLALLLFYGVLVGISGSMTNLGKQLPQYSGKIQSIARSLQGKTAELRNGAEFLMQKEGGSQGGSSLSFSVIARGMSSVFAVVVDMFLIPILAIFLLLDKVHLESRLKRAVRVFPLERFLDEITRMVRGYFFGNLAVGVGMTIAFYILFSFIGLDNRLALAVFSGFANLLPIFGAILGAVLPATQALLQFGKLGPVVVILVASGFLHFIANNLVVPKFVGATVNVNATSAMLALILFGWLWGAFGLLLAVPVVASVRIALAANARTASWAQLLAEGSAPPGRIVKLRSSRPS